MAAPRPSVVPLAELVPGQQADFYAVLLDRVGHA